MPILTLLYCRPSVEGETPCEVMDRVVGECGDLWLPCLPVREVRRIRDRQIEDILRQETNETKYEDCSVLIEYR